MAFLSALKEAREAGVSTDDFMKMWHMTKQDVPDDDAMEQNLRKGNKVTSPAMADKSKRLGWISPDPDSIERPFAADTQGKDPTEWESDDTTRLKVPRLPLAMPNQANKPQRPPRTLPRKCGNQPPAYDQVQKFKKVDGKNHKPSQQTECKFLQHSDDDAASWSDEEDRPNSADLQQLDDDQQTAPKLIYRRRKETPSGPYAAVDEPNLHMSLEEQSQLMETVMHLQEEQQALKSKLREHDLHLTSLMDRQPSVRHTLRKTVNRGHERMAYKKRHEQRKDLESVENDHLYVQIEQLYSNFCKLHLPANSWKWMLKMNQSKQLVHSKDDLDAMQDAFARRENSQGYWDIVSVKESLDLQKENEELKKKVSMLEAKLAEMHSSRSSPDKRLKKADNPMPTISRLPGLCNVTQNRLNGTDDSNSPYVNEVNWQKKPSKPTRSSENPVVAGCPVQTQPGLGSVNPVKMKFEWRISNYAKKLEMERRGEQRNLVSNPFYISHNGYLAQLEVYLNGNSSGQDNGMSVFLRILKGTFDRRLHWPVRLCFVVTVVDQIVGKNESLKRGSNGFSEFEFREPMGCSNESSDCWGFVEFISHKMISQKRFIYNDSIVLGVSLKIL